MVMTGFGVAGGCWAEETEAEEDVEEADVLEGRERDRRACVCCCVCVSGLCSGFPCWPVACVTVVGGGCSDIGGGGASGVGEAGRPVACAILREERGAPR